MRLIDTNVWLAATLSGHQHHAPAARYLGDIDEVGSIWFCRSTQQSLLRLLTSERIMNAYADRPLTNEEAISVCDWLLADGRISIADEPLGLDARWRQLASRPTASPKLWMDAYLAAFAIENDWTLATFDRAFRQFPDLQLDLLQ